MSGSVYLSSVAAVLAAVLSGTSLVFTRRWQQRDLEQRREWEERDAERLRRWQEADLELERSTRTKTWVLDAVRQALIDHVNLSFKVGRACKDGRSASRSDDLQGFNDAYMRADVLHAEYMDLMVYLRLLGTPEIVRSAESLHVSLDNLLDLTFSENVHALGRRPFTSSGTLPSGLSDEAARATCMAYREALINEARAYLNLPRDAAIDRAI